MAQDVPVASGIAAAAEHGVSAAAEPAGMEERTPLTEFLFDETGAAGTWDVKVCYSDIDDYNGSGSRSKSGAHSSSSQAGWRPGSPETDDKRNTAPTVQIVTLGVRVAGIEGFEADHLKAGMEAYVRVALGRSPAVQLDAPCFRDPGAWELIDHTGMHPVIISRLVAAKEFPLWAGAARGQILEAVRGLGLRVGRLRQVLARFAGRVGGALALPVSDLSAIITDPLITKSLSEYI